MKEQKISRVPDTLNSDQKLNLEGDTRFLQIVKVIGLINDGVIGKVLSFQQQWLAKKTKHIKVGEILTRNKPPLLTPLEVNQIVDLQRTLRFDFTDTDGAVAVPEYLQSVLLGEDDLIIAPKFSGEDKRQDKRVEVENISLSGKVQMVGFSPSDRIHFRASLINISAGGIRMRSDSKLKKASLVRLQFGVGGNKFKLLARIIAAFPDNHYGVQFVDLPEKDRLKIELVVGQALLSSSTTR